MLLTSTSDILRIVTGSAVDIDVQANWADIATGAFTPGRTNTKITTATTTTVVASPAASTQRQIKTVIIRNVHASSSNLLTVQHYDGSNSITVFKRTMLAGETVIYDGTHFIVYNAAGIVVQATEVGSLSDGDYGDVTIGGSGTTMTIDAGAVTLAKLVDATAQYKLLGRVSPSSGDFEEITGSANVFSLLQAADYAAMRTLLGLVIGTNVQAYDADLATWAGLTPSANAQSLVTAANYAAMRTLLKIGSLHDAPNSAISMASTSFVDILSKTITVAAGDTIEVVVKGELLNNSGGTRTPNYQLDFDGVVVNFADTTLANAASARALIELRATISVLSTSDAKLQLRASRSAGAAANTVTTTDNRRMAWQTTATDVTGSVTCKIQASSDSASATQTFYLNAWEIRILNTSP